MDLGGLSDPSRGALPAGSAGREPPARPAASPAPPGGRGSRHPRPGAAGAAHPRSLSQERPRRPCSSLIEPDRRASGPRQSGRTTCRLWAASSMRSPRPESPGTRSGSPAGRRRVDRVLGPAGQPARSAGFSESNVCRAGAGPGPGSCAWDAVMATAILACWPHAHTEVLSKSLDPHRSYRSVARSADPGDRPLPTRPYVLISCAMSVDGRIDDTGPARLMLSGPEDLERVDELRASADAILVGANTVRRDNPRLLIRSPRLRAARVAAGRPEHPLRVTVTTTGDLDPAARFFAPPEPAGGPDPTQARARPRSSTAPARRSRPRWRGWGTGPRSSTPVTRRRCPSCSPIWPNGRRRGFSSKAGRSCCVIFWRRISRTSCTWPWRRSSWGRRPRRRSRCRGPTRRTASIR